MNGIAIYEKDCADFSGNGLGLLYPLSCKVTEEGNGLWELQMEMSLTEDARFFAVQAGRILRVNVPVRDAPLYEDVTPGTVVTRQVYRVRTSGSRLRLRQGAATSSKVLGSYAPGTEVIRLDTDGAWYRVQVVKGGATGWMHSSYLTYVRSYEETVGGDSGTGVEKSPSRSQLFRIYQVEEDTEQGLQTSRALHIFYDLSANVVGSDYSPDGAAAAEAARQVFTRMLNDTPFTLYASELTGTVTGEYGWLSPVEAWLEADTGILSQAGGLLVRDNFDVHLLADRERGGGVSIRRGKNLAGVVVKVDESSAVTRILPCGRDADGEALFPSPKYVDSSRIGEYAVIKTQKRDYDIEVSTESGARYRTKAAAQAALVEAAQADFAAGCDLPEYTMDVDFVTLEDTEEAAGYRALQAIYMFDTVLIRDDLIGLSGRLRMTGYTWDALGERYESITLGDLTSLKRSGSGGTGIAGNSIRGSQIVGNSVDGNAIRDNSIPYAKLSGSCVTALGTALTADIAAQAAAAQSTANAAASAAQTAQGTATAAGTAAASAQSTADAAAGAVSALDTRVTALEGLEKRGSVSVSASSTGTLASLGVVTENGIYRISLAYQATTADAGAEYLFRYSGTGLSTFTRLLVIAEGAAARAPRLSSSGVLTLNSQAEAGTVRYRMNKIY